MSRRNLTDWFPPSIKPIRRGDYIASAVKDPAVRRHWNGKRWSLHWYEWEEEMRAAERRKKAADPVEAKKIRWRGLASEPKKGNTK